MSLLQIFTEQELKKLKNAVFNENIINLISYSLSEKTEKRIDIILNEILEKYKKEDVKSPIYTCIKELAVNGTKANLKSVFFENKKVPHNDLENYKKYTKKFKRILEKSKERNFGNIVYKRGFFLKISFEYSKTYVKVTVFNNCIIPKYDKERIKNKMEKAKSYESIADYYRDAFDDTEGAGMGLALIVILLKGIGLDINNFNVKIHNKGMTANVLFPLNEIKNNV